MSIPLIEIFDFRFPIFGFQSLFDNRKSAISLLVMMSGSVGLFMQAAPVKAAPAPVFRQEDAGVKTFAVDVDTYIDSRDPTYNYGVATTDKVLVNGTDGSLARVLFKLPDSIWLISQDKLIWCKVWFYVWMDRTADRTVTLHPLIRGFVEGTGDGTASGDGATWQTCDGANSWTCTGGDYDSKAFVQAVESTNWFSWDITSLWDNTNLRSFGAMLKMDDESDPGSANMPRAPFTSSDGPANERPYIEVTYADWLRADINGDGVVDLLDFALLASNWLRKEPPVDADIAPLGGDIVVDAIDLAELASHWLESKDRDGL